MNIKRLIRKQPVISEISKYIYHKIKDLRTYNSRKSLYLNTIEVVKGTDSKKKKIWYMGVPIHPNLGDLVQYLCIKSFLEKNFADHKIIEIPSLSFNFNEQEFINKIHSKLTGEDFFVMQSGYTMAGRSCHPDENVHLSIIRNFPKNKIIFFPQTILYKNKSEENETIETFRKHKNILLLARDKISYEKALQMFPYNKVELYPDIVTSLIGNYRSTNTNQNRNGILLCLRVDAEKYYEDDEINTLIKSLKETLKCNVDITDTEIPKKNCEYKTEYIEEQLNSIIRMFSNYKVIITDRYHGTIFSLIAGTPVIILKTTDHKVISGADWFGSFVLCISNILSEQMLKGDFSIAKQYLPLMLLTAILNGYSVYFGTIYVALKKNKMIMISTVLGALINIVSSYCLIDSYGIWACVFGSLFCYVLIVGIRMFDTYRYVKIDIDSVVTFSAFAILCFQAFLMTTSQHIIEFRVLLLFLVLVTLYFFKYRTMLKRISIPKRK